mgnify:CR=1 FL=1
MKVFKATILLIFLVIFLIPTNLAFGQSENPEYPVYIVQPGDTLNVISVKFNVSAEDIISANSITDANILSVGTRLLIPGIEGVSGVLTYQSVSIGENPDSLSREYRIPKETIYRLNQTTSPSEFFLGSNVILVETPAMPLSKTTLNNNQSAIELAVSQNKPVWDMILMNQLDSRWQLIPGEPIYFQAENSESITNEEVEFRGLPLTQGKSAEISVYAQESPDNGTIGDSKLNFFSHGSKFSALFGVHALQDPGLYPFHLEYVNENDQLQVIDQLILVQRGFYPQDPPLQVDPSTLDESITKPEDDLLFETTTPFTTEQYWSGLFQYPVDQPICIKSWFGNRRSYNDSPYNRFHTGVDFGVCANLNIYAPADGYVVLTESLPIRGNATVINHGLGVYSGFWHQAEFLVEEGQFVKAGDLIGIIGNTGRSTGPHLHWELVVNGIQVDPLPWLEVEFP